MIPPGIRSVLRNFGYLFGSQVLAILIGGFYAVFLARLLGPDLYGTLAYGFSCYLTLIALTYLGLDVVLARGVGREPGTAPALTGSTLALRAIAAAVASILLVAMVFVGEPDLVARELIYVLSAALLGRAIWLWCGSVFVAFENARHVLQIDLVFRPLEVLAVAFTLLFLAPKSIVAVGVVHTAFWWLQAAIGLIIVLKRITPIDFRASCGQARRLLVEGLPGALYTLTVIWFLQSPTVLFRQVAGTGDALGHFALSIQIIGYLLTVPVLVGGVALPVLSRSVARGDDKARTAAVAMMICIPTVGVVLGVLGVWLAPPLTTLIFGDRYLPTGRILGEAIWLLTPMSLATSLQQVVFSYSRNMWIASGSTILGVVAMAALYSPLTKALSYHGALLATGIGMTIWAGGLVIALIKGGILAKRPEANQQES